MAQPPKTYDEAVKRLEQLIAELEQSDALSMDAYRTKAVEAKELLAFCRKQLTDWEEQMEETLRN